MELYNLKTKMIEDVNIIVLSNGNQLYPYVFTDEGLIENGYKRVVELYPEGQVTRETEYLEKEYTETPTTYNVTYVVKQLPAYLLKEELRKYLQTILDDKAREHGYDDIVAVCSYAGYDNEFRQEGEMFGKWRARVWSWSFKVLEDIKSGSRVLPSTFAELTADMPILE